MAKNTHKPKLTNVSLTIPPDLLLAIDEYCRAHDITRSQYFRQKAREDINPQKKAA